jgi:hypothetical protein
MTIRKSTIRRIAKCTVAMAAVALTLYVGA